MNSPSGYDGRLFASTNLISPGIRKLIPRCMIRLVMKLYWTVYDLSDYVAELSGLIPSHHLRRLNLRVLGMKIGKATSIHRHCRVFFAPGVQIGSHSIINRGVLLDGRKGLSIGNNVSISEEVMLLTLEHDPQSPDLAVRGERIIIEDYAFIGTRATILPGVSIGKGAVVAAGAVVHQNVDAYTIVGGVPSRKIGDRTTDLRYQLDYKKSFG